MHNQHDPIIERQVESTVIDTDSSARQIRRSRESEMNPSMGTPVFLTKFAASVLSFGVVLTALSSCTTDDAPIASSESSPTSSIDALPSSTSSSIDTLPSSSTSEASESGPGPQTPACGIVEVTTDEVIAGVQFPIGRYQINTFGMSCEEVMGDDGFFSTFLQLADDDELPEPWSYLEGVVGAPKFVTGPSVGFRVERVAD